MNKTVLYSVCAAVGGYLLGRKVTIMKVNSVLKSEEFLEKLNTAVVDILLKHDGFNKKGEISKDDL